METDHCAGHRELKGTNLGLYQKDINVAWDLAPHDLSIILHIMGEPPVSVNCQGSAHVTPGVEDVMMLPFGASTLRFARKNRAA
jgi:predicted dehydrogenase